MHFATRTMLRGLWTLTWLEFKIFLREPLGAFTTIGIPALLFISMGWLVGRTSTAPSSIVMNFVQVEMPIFVAVFIALNAVLSLVTIIAIYREGGILRRLRATPLRPQTILGAHVIVKLLLSATTLLLTILAGKRFYPLDFDVRLFSFTCALLLSTLSILSMGFLIASLAPSARFAQPLGGLLLYPMLGVCGLFRPIESLPGSLETVGRAVPLTYAVSLLRGIWTGDPWSTHTGDLAALAAVFLICTALSAKVFRWE